MYARYISFELLVKVTSDEPISDEQLDEVGYNMDYMFKSGTHGVEVDSVDLIELMPLKQ